MKKFLDLKYTCSCLKKFKFLIHVRFAGKILGLGRRVGFNPLSSTLFIQIILILIFKPSSTFYNQINNLQ